MAGNLLTLLWRSRPVNEVSRVRLKVVNRHRPNSHPDCGQAYLRTEKKENGPAPRGRPEKTLVHLLRSDLFLVQSFFFVLFFVFVFVFDRKQLHFEDQSCIRTNISACTALAVGQIRWNEELPFRPQGH